MKKFIFLFVMMFVFICVPTLIAEEREGRETVLSQENNCSLGEFFTSQRSSTGNYEIFRCGHGSDDVQLTTSEFSVTIVKIVEDDSRVFFRFTDGPDMAKLYWLDVKTANVGLVK